MEIREKLDILIKRNGYKKTEFAAALGITYRALANYISGSRHPRGRIIKDMAALLEVEEELLTDDTRVISLTSEEKLYFYGNSSSEILEQTDSLISELDSLFKNPDFDSKDMTAFYNCISEKYFSQKAKRSKEKIKA